MKTFTLRLTDVEAEALERLAALRKVSKNQVIRLILTEEYCKFDVVATCIDNELDQIVILDEFAKSIAKSDYSGATHIYELRAAKYTRDKYIESGDATEEDILAIEDYIREIKENI